MIIFNKTYNGESLYDFTRDMAEVFDSEFNESLSEIPVDNHGFQKGKFIVNIEWTLE